MTVLKGKPVADAICGKITADIAELEKKNIVPGLAIIRVGEKPDDIYYQNSAEKRMESVGIRVAGIVLKEEISESALITKIHELNFDDEIHGILLLMPLPRHIDGEKVKREIAPEKDIDGLTPENMCRLYSGDKNGFAPCTPSAVMEMLEYNGIDVAGKNVVIVGRSLVVGKPLAMLMLAKNATVTVCHSKTKDLKSVCRQADILVAAVGRAKMINADYVSENTVVVDVGINQDENGNMCGDVDYDSVSAKASAVTPVPGGIGSITTSVLAKHTVISAQNMKL